MEKSNGIHTSSENNFHLTHLQQAGGILYGLGIVVYFISWLAVIRRPDSRWSKSAVGFTAPAWTTVIWLAGIGLVGQKATVAGLPSSFIVFISIATVFGLIHTTHAALVFGHRIR